MCRTGSTGCPLPQIQNVGKALGEVINFRREVDERIDNLLQEAEENEEKDAEKARKLKKEAEELAERERKKFVGKVDEITPPLLEESSEALLKLLLLQGENDDYDYDYIHSLGLQLSKISSDLLEIAFHKQDVSEPTRKSLKQKVVSVLKEIFSRC